MTSPDHTLDDLSPAVRHTLRITPTLWKAINKLFPDYIDDFLEACDTDEEIEPMACRVFDECMNMLTGTPNRDGEEPYEMLFFQEFADHAQEHYAIITDLEQKTGKVVDLDAYFYDLGYRDGYNTDSEDEEEW